MAELVVSASGMTFEASTGPHDGRPVLFLHGFPQTSCSWHHQLEAVAAAGLPRPRLRPAGLLARGPAPRRSADYRIGDLGGRRPRRRRPVRGLERFDLVGHDWGAMVAWVTAGRHPDRMRTPHGRVGSPSPPPSPPPSAGRGRRPGCSDPRTSRSSARRGGRAGAARRGRVGDGPAGHVRRQSACRRTPPEVRRLRGRHARARGAHRRAQLVPGHVEPESTRRRRARSRSPPCTSGPTEDIALGRTAAEATVDVGVGPVPFRGPDRCEPLDPRDGPGTS